MIFDSLKSLTIPEGVVKSISCGGNIIWNAVTEAIKNLLPTATDTDRKTIFNGIGYITGKRLSSSGSVASSKATMCASGFIPAVEGDTVYIKGSSPVSGVASYIITYDSSNTKIAHDSISQRDDASDWVEVASKKWYTYKDGVLVATLTSEKFGTGFDSFRFCCHMDENTFVTVNQEIK